MYWQRYEKNLREVYWVAHFMSFVVFVIALLGSFGVRFEDLKDLSLLMMVMFFISIGFFLALILAYINRTIIDPALLSGRQLRGIDLVYIAVFALSFFSLVVACRMAGTAFDFLFVLPVSICAWTFGERAGQTLAIGGGLGLMLVDLIISRSGDIPSEVGLARLALFLIIAHLVGKMSDSNFRLFVEVVRSEQVKKTILESMPLAVLTCGEDGRITFTNRKLGKLMDELFAHDTEVPEPERPALCAGSEEAFWSRLGLHEQLAGYEVHNLEVQVRSKWLLINKAPLKGADASRLGWVITLSDITNKKEMENRLQQSAVFSALGQMAAGLAHEIRNPLTSIRGFMQLVTERDDNTRLGEVKGRLNVAIEEIDRLARILKNFLLLATPSEQRLVRINLNDVIDEIWEILTIKALSNNAVLVRALASDLPVLLGDKDRLKQVALHLVDNALAAAGAGGRVWVETFFTRERGICMRVTDSGPGIPDSIMDSIFLPFFSTKAENTGLGLAICHRIVSEHRGSINVESGVRGTTFTVCFPPADMQVPHSPTVVELDSFLSRKQRRA